MMERIFGGLPWQFFFREKPSFSTSEGKVLVCHFELTESVIFLPMEYTLFIDSAFFPTSFKPDLIPLEEQVIDWIKKRINYETILEYFTNQEVNPLLQDWISTELDKARRTEEQIEPFLTLSFYLGDSFFSASEEGQTSLSERYKKLLRESYIPSEGVREIERILSRYPLNNDPIPYNIRAFFLPLEQEGLVKRVEDYWIILGGYNLNEFIGIMNRALDPSLKLIEFDIPVKDKKQYLRKENGEPYSSGTWDKGQQALDKRKNPLPIPRFMQ